MPPGGPFPGHALLQPLMVAPCFVGHCLQWKQPTRDRAWRLWLLPGVRHSQPRSVDAWKHEWTDRRTGDDHPGRCSAQRRGGLPPPGKSLRLPGGGAVGLGLRGRQRDTSKEARPASGDFRETVALPSGDRTASCSDSEGGSLSRGPSRGEAWAQPVPSAPILQRNVQDGADTPSPSQHILPTVRINGEPSAHQRASPPSRGAGSQSRQPPARPGEDVVLQGSRLNCNCEEGRLSTGDRVLPTISCSGAAGQSPRADSRAPQRRVCSPRSGICQPVSSRTEWAPFSSGRRAMGRSGPGAPLGSSAEQSRPGSHWGLAHAAWALPSLISPGVDFPSRLPWLPVSQSTPRSPGQTWTPCTSGASLSQASICPSEGQAEGRRGRRAFLPKRFGDGWSRT